MTATATDTGLELSAAAAAVKASLRGIANFTVGLGVLFALWWMGAYLLSINPQTASFATFGPIPTFQAFPVLWENGKIQSAVMASGYRLGVGLAIAIIIGVPIGILVGRSKRFRELSNSPFQFLRMISPLSWTPVALFVFATWNQSIIFLIAVASVWPVIYATSAGLAKVDPAWFKVARNLGASPIQMLTRIIMPAITFDVLTGVRLALGVAWVVIIPAEFLGVTTGLGYTIQDARETLSYNNLTAMVLTIGVMGYVLDSICVLLIKRYSWQRGAV
jgi:ABC-type nitrate/sulfonate/bicarbonate transport system, permease component